MTLAVAIETLKNKILSIEHDIIKLQLSFEKVLQQNPLIISITQDDAKEICEKAFQTLKEKHPDIHFLQVDPLSKKEPLS